MKISVIGPLKPYRGGISQYNTLLCNSLSKMHDLQIISFKRLYPNWLYPGTKQKDNNGFHQSASYILDSINPVTWIKAYTLARKSDFTIFHWWTTYFAPCFLVICMLLKYFSNSKIVFICHNVLPHEEKAIDTILTRLVLRNSNYFIVNSQKDLNDLSGLVNRPNVKKCNHAPYHFNSGNEVDIRLVYNLKKNVILFFGFVRPYKGLMYLLRAMPLITDKIDLDLLVIGEFWDDKQIYLNEIRKLKIIDSVKIIDHYIDEKDVSNYFNVADIVVLPYVSATQSAVVYTAFNFNKPAIVTDCGGPAEIIEHGKTGYVVKAKDAQAIADAVIDFYMNDRKDYFIENVIKIKQNYSWDNLAKEIIEHITH